MANSTVLEQSETIVDTGVQITQTVQKTLTRDELEASILQMKRNKNALVAEINRRKGEYNTADAQQKEYERLLSLIPETDIDTI